MTHDPSTRLPPGQITTRKWPVLHYGTVPSVDLTTWRFEVSHLACQVGGLGRISHQSDVLHSDRIPANLA